MSTTEAEITLQTTVEDKTTTTGLTTPVNSENVTNSNCSCQCTTYLNPDDPDYLEKLYTKLESIRKELYIEEKTLSRTTQRLISAPDERPSSKYIGAVGISVLVIVGLAIVLPDFVNVCSWLFENMKK